MIDMGQERGKFVVLEGGSGCGKSTQFLYLLDLLSEEKNWSHTREPGRTIFGEKIRYLVQDEKDKKMSIHPYAALFAYSASRANLIRGFVIPQINSGGNVLQDRYWFSTFAYQGAEGVSKPVIWLVSAIATRMLKPDLVIHYDVLPEIGMQRKMDAIDSDRYDEMQLEFHRKVRKNYFQIRKFYPGIWRTIDASQTREKVFEDTKRVLSEFSII